MHPPDFTQPRIFASPLVTVACVAQLQANHKTGLTKAEAVELTAKWGPNELPEKKVREILFILAESVESGQSCHFPTVTSAYVVLARRLPLPGILGHFCSATQS